MDMRCVVSGLLTAFCMCPLVYANNDTVVDNSRLFPEQVLSENTTSTLPVVDDTTQVTGTGATGEAQTAEMDQNGRWHVKEQPNSSPPKSVPPAAPLPPIVKEQAPPGMNHPASVVPQKQSEPGKVPAPPPGRSGETVINMAPRH